VRAILAPSARAASALAAAAAVLAAFAVPAAAGPSGVQSWDIGRPVARASLLAIDLDRDGAPELAVGADSVLYIFRADGTPYFEGGAQAGPPLSGPIIGELAGSERFVLDPESPVHESWIAASVAGGGMHVWNKDGLEVGEVLSEVPTTAPVFPAGFDFPAYTRYAVAGRSDGSLSYFPYELVIADGAWCGGEVIAALSTVNRTGIGGDEVVAVSEGGLVGVFPAHAGASMSLGWPPGGVATGGGQARSRRRWVVSGDFDRSDASTPEIVVADSIGTIHVLDSVGNELPGWPVTLEAPPAAGPVLGDVDGDGRLEIVVADVEGRVHVLRASTHEARGWPRSFGAGETAGADAPALVLDVDTATGRNVLAYVGAGRIQEPGAGTDWDVSPARPAGSPVAADFDRDGLLEIAAIDTTGRVFLLPTGADALRSEGQWRMAGYDIERRASFPGGHLPELVVPSEVLPPSSVACYPNPAPGAVLFVHYALGRPAEVSLDLFDMAGKRVVSAKGTSFIGDDNTIGVPLAALAGGVYVLRIRAAADSGTITLTEKIAVVR